MHQFAILEFREALDEKGHMTLKEPLIAVGRESNPALAANFIHRLFCTQFKSKVPLSDLAQHLVQHHA